MRAALPGGKLRRRLPGRSGEVGAKALEHPALVSLVEAGELVVGQEGRGRRTFGGDQRGHSGSTGHDPDRTIRHSGDGWAAAARGGGRCAPL